jgi:surface protein
MLVLDFAGLGLGLSSCFNNPISDSLLAPVNSVNPVISGTNNIGQVLTTTNGTWTGSPTFTYQWYRGVSAISGQTASTYTIQYLDLYNTASSITCEVTATNAAGTDAVTSNGITPVVLPFVFEVKTDNAGSSTSTQFKLPLTTSSGLSIVVDWGDSTTSTITSHTSLDATHTYLSIGTYTISITGALPGWQFNNAGDKLKILNISSWGALNITTASTFRGCTNLTCSAADAPKRTGTSLQFTFRQCTNFNGAVGNWYTTGVTSLSNMFQLTSAFNQDLGDWDTSSVTELASMFNGASAFNNGGSSSINNWNTGAFTGAALVSTFQSATVFNQPIGNWNITNVTSLESTFQSAIAFNQDISGWSTSNVTNMARCFLGATVFNQNIAGWNTGKVTTLVQTFQNALAFNQDISNWDIGTDIGAAVTVFTSFMSGKVGGNALSTANYDAILDITDGWPSQGGISPGESPSFSGAKYSPGVVNSGTATSTATNKLIQTGQNFLSTVTVGDIVRRTFAATYAEVTAVDSDTQLSLSSNLMTTTTSYTIEGSNAAKGRFKLLTTNTWTIGDGGPA